MCLIRCRCVFDIVVNVIPSPLLLCWYCFYSVVVAFNPLLSISPIFYSFFLHYFNAPAQSTYFSHTKHSLCWKERELRVTFLEENNQNCCYLGPQLSGFLRPATIFGPWLSLFSRVVFIFSAALGSYMRQLSTNFIFLWHPFLCLFFCQTSWRLWSILNPETYFVNTSVCLCTYLARWTALLRHTEKLICVLSWYGIQCTYSGFSRHYS